MKKLLYILIGVGLATAGVVYAAPGVNIFRNIQPETDSLYYNGTTTKAWLGVVSDEYCLTGDSCITSWPVGGGGGGSGGGWSTSSPNIISTNWASATNALVGINSSTPKGILVVKGISGTTTPVLLITSSTNATLLRVDGNGSTTIPSLGAGLVRSTSGGSLYIDSATYLTSAITSLGGQTGATQTFSTSTTATGLTLNITSATNAHNWALALTSGYNIPLTASTTEWYNFHTTPSGRITAGSYLTWSGNTLNSSSSPSFTGLNVTGTSTLATTSLSQLTTSGNVTVGGDMNVLGSEYAIQGNTVISWNGTAFDIANGALNIVNATGASEFSNNLNILGALSVTATTTLTAATTTINGLNYYWPSSVSGTKILQNDGSGNLSWVADQTGGGSLSGGVKGLVGVWASSTGMTTGILIDNGTVAGANASSSTVTFNVQGTGALSPFNVASSTGQALFTINSSGQALASSGIASLPGIAFQNDTNTGIYWGAADTIAFSTGGTNYWNIDSAGDLRAVSSSANLRLSGNGTVSNPDLNSNLDADTGINLSNDNTMVFVAGGAERGRFTTTGLGLGTTTPVTRLGITGSTTADSLDISSTSGTSILRVTQGGNVGIGTTTPIKLLHVFGDQTGGIARIERNTGTSTLQNTLYGTYDVRMWSATTSSNILTGAGPTQTFSYATSTGAVTLADFGAVIGGNENSGKFVIRPYFNGSAQAVAQLTLDGWNSTAGIGSSTPYSNFVVQSGSGGTFPIFTVATSTGSSFLQVTAGGQILACTTCRLTIPQGTAPSLTTVGDIGVDTSNGGMFSFYASGRENLVSTTTKAFFISSPTASESHKTSPYYCTDVPITITKVTCSITSDSNNPSWTFSLPHSTALGTASANVMTSGQTCTATTTPQNITIAGDLTLAAGECIWATSSAVSLASSTSPQIYFKYDN